MPCPSVPTGLLLMIALAMGTARDAQAQPSEVRVAIYAPWAGPSTADERFAFGSKLADAVRAAGLGTARVSSFAKLQDFRRALASTAVDIALIDAGAISALGSRLDVVASWSSGERWILAGVSRPAALRGKRLALQAADAPTSVQVMERLLRGQVTSRYWSAIVGAPVTADARQLVLRDGADLVLVPSRLAAGLTEIADLGTFTELAIAIRTPALAGVSTAIQGAIRTLLGGSWRATAPRFPAPIAPTQLEVARSAATSLSFLDLLAPLQRTPPELVADEMWIEPDAP